MNAPASPTPSPASADDQTDRVAICITTHDRVDCARINIEIARLNYPASWKLVHACSNQDYTQHLEDHLVRCEPKGLTEGALNLLRQSIQAAQDHFQPDYVVHVEADTWVLDSAVITRYVHLLAARPEAVIAASRWSTDKLEFWQHARGLRYRLKYHTARLLRRMGIMYGQRGTDSVSTQFFVARCDARLIRALADLQVQVGQTLEEALYQRLVSAHGTAAIIGMPEREPVHPRYRWKCEALSLYGQHWPTRATRQQAPADYNPMLLDDADCLGKKEVLENAPWLKRGPSMDKLLQAQDVSYYNGRAKRY